MAKKLNTKNISPFFVIKLIEGYEKDIGFIIEIERITNHIESLTKILLNLAPERMNEMEEMIYWSECDSTITIIFNIMASQLRESLKLLGEFKGKSLYNDWNDWIKKTNNSEYIALDNLIRIVDEWKTGKGFLIETLKELRNVTFHYDVKKAQSWFNNKIEEYKDDIKAQREFFILIDKKNPHLGLGQDYDSSLNSKHLIFTEDLNLDNMFKNLSKMQELQMSFITLKNSISKFLIERNG